MFEILRRRAGFDKLALELWLEVGLLLRTFG